MTIRIVHTADNHIDLGFKNYPDSVRDILCSERMDALKNIVNAANKKQAHFLVVAGDLFDGVNPNKRIIKSVVDVLGSFEGHVLILPGNHDYYTGSSSELWNRLKLDSSEKQIRVLSDPKMEEFDIDGQKVQFFPCPCRTKTSKENAIGWVIDQPRTQNSIQIGIAHGNVEGLGLDTDDKYFNMSRTELRGAKMHAWLLGHIHRPFPDRGGKDAPDFFMAGSHAPQSVLRNHAGSAWYIELNINGVLSYETINCSKIEFRRIAHTFNAIEGFGGLTGVISSLVAEKTVLDLVLDGTLNDSDFKNLSINLDNIEAKYGFVHVKAESKDVVQEISLEQIQNRFANNSFANHLLSNLLRSENKNDVRVALKLIEGIGK